MTKPLTPLAELRARLAAGECYAHIFCAINQFPGLYEDETQRKQAIVRLAQQNRAAVEIISKRLIPDSDNQKFRAKAAIAQAIAPLLTTAWTKRQGDFDVEEFAEEYLQCMEISTPLPEEAFDNTERIEPRAVIEGLMTAKALPTLQKLSELPGASTQVFAPNFSIESMAATIRQDIVERSERLSATLIPADISDDDKSQSSSRVLDQISTLYCKHLGLVFSKMRVEFKSMSNEEKKKFMEDLPNHPEGVLLSRTRQIVDDLLPVLYPNIISTDQSQRPRSGPSM